MSLALPVQIGELTREHVGPGGGRVVITEFLGNVFSISYAPADGPVVEDICRGPIEEVQRRADQLVGHACTSCAEWPVLVAS